MCVPSRARRPRGSSRLVPPPAHTCLGVCLRWLGGPEGGAKRGRGCAADSGVPTQPSGASVRLNVTSLPHDPPTHVHSPPHTPGAARQQGAAHATRTPRPHPPRHAPPPFTSATSSRGTASAPPRLPRTSHAPPGATHTPWLALSEVSTGQHGGSDGGGGALVSTCAPALRPPHSQPRRARSRSRPRQHRLAPAAR